MSADNAKHWLMCEHHLGSNIKYYRQKCDVLKTMADGRLKIRSYGRLFWSNTQHISRVQYVKPHRVMECMQ